MIFVHVPDGIREAFEYSLLDGRFSTVVEGFLVEGPGRASAALLSVVSGYLAATTLLKPDRSVIALYRRRFFSIILPMLFWGLLTYGIYWLASLVRPTFLDDAHSVLDKLNIVLFLTDMPLGPTLHLGFLRDLFVCLLLSPLLLLVLRHVAWLVLPLLGLWYVFDHDPAVIVILRPLVLFAFCIGMTLSVRRFALDSLDRFWPLFLLGTAAATLAILGVNSGLAADAVARFAARGLAFDETVLYPICRLFGSLAIWTLIPSMLGGRLQAWATRYSPYLFAAFCGHYLMLTIVFHLAWEPLFGGRDSAVFLLWFLMAPLLAMTIAVLIVSIAQRLVPPLATLLTGGRLAPVQAAAPMAKRQGLMPGAWRPVLNRMSKSVAGLIHPLFVRRRYCKRPVEQDGQRVLNQASGKVAGVSIGGETNPATRTAVKEAIEAVPAGD